MKLTDMSVKALTVGAGQRTFFDDTCPGFGVRVSPRSKTFVVVMRRNSATRWETLGKYPEPLSLAEARKRARVRLNSTDPINTPITFEEAFAEYQNRHLSRVRPDTAHEQARILKVRFQPVFAKKRLDRVATRDIACIIDDIPGNASARAAFIAMRTFLNWCIKRDYLQTSPISRLECPKQRERSRVLSDEELVRVWRSAPASVYGDIVKLLLLSGQRRGQIAALKPAVIVQGNVLTWPPRNMKSNRIHSIPLTPMVDAILARYPDGLPSLKHWAWFKTKLDKACGVHNWVLHDLRRTLATKLAEMRVAPHIIERILAHSGSISGVAAIYNRYSYLAEMREALQSWEQRLHTLVSTTENTNGADATGHDCEGQRAAE
jgi:integrase